VQAPLPLDPDEALGVAPITTPNMASNMAPSTERPVLPAPITTPNMAPNMARPVLPAAGALTGQTAALSCLKLSNDGIGGKYTRSIWSSLSKHPGL
jgi:hypothetical protein